MKLNQNTISKIGKELQSLVKGEVLFDEFQEGDTALMLPFIK